MTIRSLVKRAIEIGLVGSGTAAILRRLHRTDAVILAYHNVVEDESPDAGDSALHLRRSDLINQLEMLARTHEIVPLDRLISEDRNVRARPRAALTFDDAYHGAVTIAVPEIAMRGHPVTVFVSPSFLDGGVFWWDALADSGGNGLDPETRAVVLDQLAGDTVRAKQWAAGTGKLWNDDLPATHKCVSTSKLERAASMPEVTLGSHTWTHANLTRISDAQLREELTRPLNWLRERFERVSGILCYPYGSYSAGIEAAAAGLGYHSGLRVEGGTLRGDRVAAFSAPRINVPARLSRDGFLLRTAGLLGG